MGREDRKDGVHSGNRVLTRIYNHGAIGDLSSAFSGVYPIGSGHAYIFEFSPVIAASVVDKMEIESILFLMERLDLQMIRLKVHHGVSSRFLVMRIQIKKIFAMSDNVNSWPESWPNRPSDWDGEWNGQYGKYVRADQESYFCC